jgi:hypothetical protein
MSYDVALRPLELESEDLERIPGGPRYHVRRERARIWLSRHWTGCLLVLGLLVVCGVVHARGMYQTPARFDDEGTYTAYAWAVQYWHQLGHYTYWYAHPPLGWIQIAIWSWATHVYQHAPYAVAATRQFMLVCELVSVALLYGLARRLGMNKFFATVAVLLFSLSPLAVYFQRAALLDNVVTPWLLGAFFLAASPRRHLGAAAGSAACLAAAVLSKETALLFLPAVVLLLWQHTDHRNRRFTLTMFATVLVLLGALFPLYALIKNELLPGHGHVSLIWAIKWQLMSRKGSGSIFDPHSTAHNVITTWMGLDPWLPKLALAFALPGLLIRRVRPIALAFTIQVLQLLRNGYLPYPYVIAMIPFGALTVAGVLDAAWKASRLPIRVRLGRTARRIRLRLERHPVGWLAFTRQAVLRVVVMGVGIALVATLAHSWPSRLQWVQTANADEGKAQALAWVEHNVPHSARLVVDDSYWVDLVRNGYPADKVIWFTKLDVDPALDLPKLHAWRVINYVLIDHQDDLSEHLNLDGSPSPASFAESPALAAAIQHSEVVAAFGKGGDTITVRKVFTEPRSKYHRIHQPRSWQHPGREDLNP